MPRKVCVPVYRLHKQSGQAVVTLPDSLGRRRDVLLGTYDSPESKQEYQRVIAEWIANGRRAPVRCAESSAQGLSVNELILAYFTHVQSYYRHPDGQPTSEVGNIRRALRWAGTLYGHTEAARFDGPALEAIRGKMIEAKLCRSRINKDVARLKRMFKWGSVEEPGAGGDLSETDRCRGAARRPLSGGGDGARQARAGWVRRGRPAVPAAPGSGNGRVAEAHRHAARAKWCGCEPSTWTPAARCGSTGLVRTAARTAPTRRPGRVRTVSSPSAPRPRRS